MSSILLLTHPISCSQEDFVESLKDAADSKTASIDHPSVLPEIDASQVQQCVLGPNHIALLMQDGSICRVAFHVTTDKSSGSTIKDNSTDDEITQASSSKKPAVSSPSASVENSSQNEQAFTLSGEALNSLTGTLGRWTHRVSTTSNNQSGTTSTNSSVRAAIGRGRGRIIRAATRARAGTAGWLSSRAVIPASAVPEELVSQAQVVLQGKSRQVIIRELQKTSLDVNLAVNNLLSRDDDDPDEQDEESFMQETYIPSEDLMSIFETSIPGDEPFVVQRDAIFPEDLIYNPSYNRNDTIAANRANTHNESVSGSRDEGEKELSSRIRDRWWMLMMDGKDKSSTKLASSCKLKSSKVGTSHRFGEIEWWKCEKENGEPIKFVHIAALYSELLAVCEDGFLYQWRWNNPEVPHICHKQHNHFRAQDMKITASEKIVKVAACNVRVTVLTESGKLSTWLDGTIASFGHRLEHPLQAFSELKGYQVVQLHVCDLYSCVQLSNGQLYWWGVFPYEQRKKILDRVKTKAKKSAIIGSSQIKPGTLVCIRSCPLYYPGALGFTTVKGEPKIGELLDKAWSISEKCRFKIINRNNMDASDIELKSAARNETENTDVPMEEIHQLKSRKRKYVDNESNVENIETEEWFLQDVIFVEEVRNVPVGEVLKVDGAYAMVHFSSKILSNNAEDKKYDFDVTLRESVIKRKDELQIVKWTTPPKMPECYQKFPKQLTIPTGSKVLTMLLDQKGVHTILRSSGLLRFTTFSLASGKPDSGGYLQHEPSLFLSKVAQTSISLLNCSVDSVAMLQDPNGCLYPIIKDNIGGIQNPTWNNLSTLSCYASGIKKSATSQLSSVTLLVIKGNEFHQNILKCDVEAVEEFLKRLENNPELISSVVNSKIDGNRNVLHLCVATCQPVSSKSDANIDRPENDSKDDSYKTSFWTPVFDGSACLELILKCTALNSSMYQLLSQKDAFGYTPFMTAVRIRAYGAALKLYNMITKASTAHGTTERNNEQFVAMICPHNTNPDMSPLQILCCNDTCSFTWTGTKHINQDIFECKTCGLVGPLCCCTECAQVCHIGHECKLKRTSPTAYCDCWEKCPCKSLIPGNQHHRVKLLHKLIDETDLATLPNKKGQHILLFLAQTVARQASEQLQYIPNRMSSNDSSKQRSGSTNRSRLRSQTPPPPNHDLEPPKFSKLSLAYILRNWQALKSMILFGCSQTGTRRANALDDPIISASMLQGNEIGKYLDSQSSTSSLDNFVHKLLVKCNAEFLEQMIQTLEIRLRETELTAAHDEALQVTKRLIRAVVRVYVILTACTGSTANKKKGVSTAISKCKRVFVSLNMLAAQELAHVAATIFAPVRMGVVYPSAPFMLASIPDSTAVSEDLFSTPPLPERLPSTQHHSSSQRVRFADRPIVEESTSQVSQGSSGETSHSQQESDMDNDLLGESDTDSEESNNGDVNEVQSTNTTSTSGNRRGRADGYFSTTEASETDGEDDDDAEDDDDDDGDEDEDDDEEEDENESSHDNTTEPRRHGTVGNTTAPHALQWAVRNSHTAQTSPSTTTAAHVSGSGLVFIDATQLRRSGASAGSDGTNSNSMFCTPSALARTFAILTREFSDLLSLTNDCCNLSGVCLPIDEKAVTSASKVIDTHLRTTWQWLWNVMETTESQLRFGASLTAVSDPHNPQHPLFDNQKVKVNSRSGAVTSNILRSWGENRRKKRGAASSNINTNDSLNARHEYLSYILSLMRSHEHEHGDALPKLEVTSLRHVVYVLDAFIYHLRSRQPADSPGYNVTLKKNSKDTELRPSELPNDEDDETDPNDNDDDLSDVDALRTARHRFFKRSDSTLVLGYESSDPFGTCLKEALPVADRPHLLNPTARRDQLFGYMKSSNMPSCPQPITSMRHENYSGSSENSDHLNLPPNIYLGRWHMCLELFGRVFLDDVGTEPHSVLTELGRFDVKEGKFRREMEKLRNSHQKDLYIEGLDRSRTLILQQSLRQLNSQFGRLLPDAGPLSIHRLKVSFRDEPGEGSGVARSFYTAISNAFLANEGLPRLDNIFNGSRALSSQLRARAKERERERRRSSGTNQNTGMIPRIVRRGTEQTPSEIEAFSFSRLAPPFNPTSEASDLNSDEDYKENVIPIQKRELARRIHKKLLTTHPENANKITGMLLELSQTQLIYLLTHEDLYREKITEAAELLAETTGSMSNSQDATMNNPTDHISLEEESEEAENDNLPLFFQPGKPGYYSPTPGKNSPERLNCMRNVGRIVGLCLLQNEICPLSLNRHVIKYMLGKKISWHDLAFFDPTLYESLRHLIQDAQRADCSEFFSSLDLTYCIQLCPEEGGGSVELIKGGNQVEVAPDNVHDYVRKYAEYRMVVSPKRVLQEIRRGLLDVVPSTHLEGLTAEDFRLLLNGAGDINVQQLMNYTFFSDETGGEGQEKLSKFKKWFWMVVENMTPKQKQDLLYFWTSSPAMPASAEGFQPMPSVTIKPANDHQLPTANTCISRLYVPLYSSKAILKSKFLMAIKIKVFGFV